LGSINLALMLRGEKKKEVDWEKLKEVVHLAVRFLDNVIEVNPFPLEEITQTVLLNRRIGLGVMGWADMLFQLEIPYESPQAVKLGEKIMKFIQKEGHKTSQQLAKERGPFPNFSKSIYKNGSSLRNATVTTIAPTGSLSILANCSSGIEPLFALSFRHKTPQRELVFVNPYFLEVAKKYRLSSEIIKKVEEEGSLKNTDAPLKLKKIFATAHEISWKGHIDMQAAFQKGTDNAVSKTINFPHEATVEEVKNAYLYAYKKGCVGITVYRDRCKETQVLYVGKEEKKKLEIKPRPMVVSGKTFRIQTPVGTAFITINVNGDENPLEVFITVGKAGSDVRADSEAIGRLISLCLRLGADFSPKEVLAQIVDQLEGIGGSSSIGFGKDKVRSLADGVAKVLRLYLGEEKEISLAGEQPSLPLTTKPRDICPKCGQATLIYEEGCLKCSSCGYSKC
jgi:ribonucleoside-diphosphate reductase alpha chain